MADQVGMQLGNYRLIRLLGEGGFARVYLGKHIHLETRVAIKMLLVQMETKDNERFRNEARIVAHLVHPHIVRVLDYGIEGNTPFLVMDYAPNGTLRQRHPKGSKLALREILPYVKQVAAAVQYAHNQKLVHRDIKPENMLLDANNQVLLADFGIAVIAHSTRSQSMEALAGTAPYMAPEQIKGKPALASDQYALGIVVYEWLCGERPFQGSFHEIYAQHMFAAPPPLCEKDPTILPGIEEVVLRALAKDPKERFPSIEMFATAFEQACQLPPPLTPVVLPDQEVTRPPSSDGLLPSFPQTGEVNAQSFPSPLTGAVSKASPLPDISAVAGTQSISSVPTAPLKSPSVNLPNQHDQKSLLFHATKPPKEEVHRTLPLPASAYFNPVNAVIPSTNMPGLPRLWKPHKPSLIGIIFISIVILFILIAGMGYLTFQSAISVNITVAPQVKPISKVFTITAKPDLQSVDTATASVPAGTLTSTQTVPLTTIATARANVEKQIAQDLQRQAQAAGVTQVGNISYSQSQVNSQASTMTEDGSVETIKTKDVQTLAQVLLQRQVEQNYALMNDSIRLGQPVAQSVDNNGNVTIAIAAGGLERYQITPAQIANIQNYIVGMKVDAVRKYLSTSPGIDPKTIGIRISYGDTIPDNSHQIKVVVIDPTNLPAIQLPAVQPAGSPSSNANTLPAM